MHIEPGLVLITPTNEVRLLPGQPGGDPLVMQVGRLLRAMLVGTDVPPELRLLLSQATFELPIFRSVGDLAQALRQVAGGTSTGDAATALVRAKKPPMAHPTFERPPRSLRPILPPPPVRGIKAGSVRVFFNTDALLVGAILVAAAIIGGLVMSRSNSRVDDRRVASNSAITASPTPAAAPASRGHLHPSVQRSARRRSRARLFRKRTTGGGIPSGRARPGKIKYHVSCRNAAGPAQTCTFGEHRRGQLVARDSERKAAALIADGRPKRRRWCSTHSSWPIRSTNRRPVTSRPKH
jgi:hypothetical protein